MLTADELAAARAAAERYVDTPPDELPDGFRVDGRRYEHGFAFDRALERLTMHPATWPIVTELTRGRPRLVSGTLQINAAATDQVQPLRLHCARDDYGWDAIRYEVRDGRIFCDPHGGVSLPHRRAPGRRRVAGGAGLPQVAIRAAAGAVQQRGGRDPRSAPPRGVENITPGGGDMVVMNELVTHGALPWTPRDRRRMILVLRYMPQYSRAPRHPRGGPATARAGHAGTHHPRRLPGRQGNRAARRSDALTRGGNRHPSPGMPGGRVKIAEDVARRRTWASAPAKGCGNAACYVGLCESEPRRSDACRQEGSGSQDQEGGREQVTTQRTQIGREVESALGEVLAHVRGEVELPGGVIDDPTAERIVALRKRMKLSRQKFADRFGLDARAVQDWEQGRRVPDRAARVLLTVIDREPEAVVRAIGST